jgi:hypothetical protein
MVVFFMGSNKVPQDSIAYPYANYSIAPSNSCGIKGFLRVNALEMKAGVIGILFETIIGGICLILYITWQLFEPFAKFFR